MQEYNVYEENRRHALAQLYYANAQATDQKLDVWIRLRAEYRATRLREEISLKDSTRDWNAKHETF